MKKVLAMILNILIILALCFLGLQILAPELDRESDSRAAFLNKVWGNQVQGFNLPDEAHELYAKSELTNLQGDGCRYYVLQYGEEDAAYFESAEFLQSITAEELAQLQQIDDLNLCYDALEITDIYKPNSLDGNCMAYVKTFDDNDRLYLFFCASSIVNGAKYGNVLYVMESLY